MAGWQWLEATAAAALYMAGIGASTETSDLETEPQRENEQAGDSTTMADVKQFLTGSTGDASRTMKKKKKSESGMKERRQR